MSAIMNTDKCKRSYNSIFNPPCDYDLRATYAKISSSIHNPFYDFDLSATHARALLPTASASVAFSFGFVFVRVQINWGVWGVDRNSIKDLRCFAPQ